MNPDTTEANEIKTVEFAVEFEVTGIPDPSWDYYPVWDLVQQAKQYLAQIEEEIEKHDIANADCDEEIDTLAQYAIEKINLILP